MTRTTPLSPPADTRADARTTPETDPGPASDQTRPAIAAPTRPVAQPHDARRSSPRLWPQWLLLAAFSFIALESVLMAVTMQGRWFIVLAPGTVCAFKAAEVWRLLRRAKNVR